MKRHKSIALARFLSLATIAILLLLTVSAQAQTPDSSVVDSRKAQLQAELDQLEVKIDQQKAILTSKQQGRVSLERDVAILDAKIKIDGSGDRVFRRTFLSYLRRELNNRERIVMKKCRMEDSKSNVLIQMADMIAGSINRSYSGKNDANDYKSVIKKHIEDEWKFR